jgi:hydrogenase maturation protein HypF
MLRRACRIELRGRVQGVGFRPAVVRLAESLDLAGRVWNGAGGVCVEVEGEPEGVARFLNRLRGSMPIGAELEGMTVEEVPAAGLTGFVIERETSTGALGVRIPLDRVTCGTCLSEVNDPADRRSGYVFTSCVDCGPRFSVLEGMPYERSDLTMRHFALCGECSREYGTSGDRRFHAETTCCACCGPRIWAEWRGGEAAGRDGGAIEAATRMLSGGGIVAVRGLGGYQLLVDARNRDAVMRLRRLKPRPWKPLAVMVLDLESARRVAMLDEEEARVLSSPAGPIVLARARGDSPVPGEAVHPGLGDIGLMLPTTALHWALARGAAGPLVCTSGNREGDPLAYEVEDARAALGGVADLYVHHDRPIAHAIDDSVVRVIGGRVVALRLARGYAPLALELGCAGRAGLLALGSFQKVALAWSNGEQCVLGPHLGDLDTLGARRRLEESIRRMEELYRFRVERAVGDLAYTGGASWAEVRGLAVARVQHHRAHVAAGMLEHGWLDREVLGLAWDGTGDGGDGTVWGCEGFVGRAGQLEHVSRLRRIRLPGGEQAIREPWRVGLMLVAGTMGEGEAARWGVEVGIEPGRVKSVLAIGASGTASPWASSMGRLFDGIASLVLGITQSDEEGEPAMRLEAVVERNETGSYGFALTEVEGLVELDWRPVVREVMADRERGFGAGVIAARFHRAVARGVLDLMQRWRELPVTLTGGVFQNRCLVEMILEEVSDGERRRLGLPGLIPPGDGGLAAGQLVLGGLPGR